MPAERRFRAMGSDCHLIVAGGPGAEADRLADRAVARVAELERRWSRFVPTSDVSRVNAASPRPVGVAADTLELARRAVEAARETGGRFDATQLPSLLAAGYDRTFAEIAAAEAALAPTSGATPAASRAAGTPDDAGAGGRAPLLPPSAGQAPGAALTIDPDAGTVAVAGGHGLDPGGIGKGLAADLVSAELLAAGADGALVNLGGDLRVRGHGPDEGDWPLSVADPFDPEGELLRLAIGDGALATSSRLLRRWHDGCGRPVHHLLDPFTGAPTETDVVAVTVLAAEGWWAEALTKALFTLDAERGLGHVHHAAAVIVDGTGRVHASPELRPLLALRPATGRLTIGAVA